MVVGVGVNKTAADVVVGEILGKLEGKNPRAAVGVTVTALSDGGSGLMICATESEKPWVFTIS